MAAREHIFLAQLLFADYLNGEREEGIIPRRNDYVSLSEEQFLERYRISKIVAAKVLQEIEDRLEYPTNRNLPLTPMQQLLVGLRFYASGSFQLTVGDTVGISKATASRVVSRVSAAIASLRPQYIVFPREEDRARIIQDFYNIANFPGVLGAIDCTHVKIQSPGGNMGEIFRNRKGYFSVNVQTICDSKLLIRDIVARWPGSAHDSTIFNNSHIRAEYEMGRIANGILLGDNVYPLRKYLLTPFLNPNIRSHENYNRANNADKTINNSNQHRIKQNTSEKARVWPRS